MYNFFRSQKTPFKFRVAEDSTVCSNQSFAIKNAHVSPVFFGSTEARGQLARHVAAKLHLTAAQSIIRMHCSS
jgi:hypothetical protein